MAFLEKTGKSVDEAVAEALKALNITADQAEIEVLEEGKKAFFGLFGGKDAKVRVTVKEAAAQADVKEEIVEAAPEKTLEEATAEAVKAVKEATNIAVSTVSKNISKKADELKEQAADAAEELGKKAAAAKDQAVDTAISTLEAMKSEKGERPAREPRKYAVNDESVNAAKEFLQKVFNAMKIDVVMEVLINKNDGRVTFKLHGDDMGILIG